MIESENFLVIRSELLARFSDLWRTLDEALVDVTAFKKKIKLSLGQHDVTTVKWVDASKQSMLKALANKHKSSPIVVQALAATAALIQKYKQMAGKRVLPQNVFDPLK